MSFYKKTTEELLVAPNFVMGPGFELRAEQRAEYTYPVDGWYWFDTLDEAIAAFAKNPQAGSVSPRQIRQAMNRTTYGSGTLRDAVEAAVAAGDRDLKDWWDFSSYFERTSPHVAAMATALNVSEAALDELWALAATL